ncbi:ABC transporter ATP-binding protein [Schleiferilactobacillus perolens]|jgi:ABC-2 type transport system ATP-binding protein|uniref:ABC transporter ATP-binding protein n=1 Tax=Schleiferilactobacillus perolens TaxID=100468 RepID=UPI002354B329|nr:ATP-binding cassette domain-containing protein [Schleiferilactobacillus perolens]MCI2172365.1 ATP-binding cassette domain-containing protein [Schleiferilactobacillus perolens]
MLTVTHVEKVFSGQKVLDDVNLTLSAGEVIHISGGNGSGKSTLLKIIADLLKPDAGTSVIDGHVELGALIENPGFIETETLKRNLLFLLSIRHQTKLETILPLVSRFGLDIQNRASMKKYSIGMREKVGIIQAVMEDQQLILLDEPTRGLDEQSLTELVKLIAELRQQGKTIIIASHDQATPIAYTDRYVLERGELTRITD